MSRLHQVLEAGRRFVLAGRRGCTRQSPRDRQCGQLAVVDPNAVIKRHACKGCGVHMYGRIENEKHPFFGVGTPSTRNYRPSEGWAPPEFAAFVSSIIESGTNPADMGAVRARLEGVEARAL